MFSGLNVSLESRKRRGGAFVFGVFCDALMLGAVFFLSQLPANEWRATHKNYAAIWLPDLTPPEKTVSPPHRVPAPTFAPKLKPPEVSKLKEIPVPKLEVPEVVHPAPNLPVVQRAMAQPISVPPSPPLSRESSVRTGLFGGAAQPVTVKRPLEAVQTGGFGDPNGLPGRGQGDSANDVPKLESFALPDGGGKGNGTGGVHGVQGVVASAGFGNGVAGSGTNGTGNGTGNQGVSLGGFSKAAPVAPSAGKNVQPSAAMDFQPVEILSKPDPIYTEEARRLGVQGEVKLSVVFQAGGVIHVMGVVKSLGHGLDQAAEQAAAQIRFKPAQREGKPVDFPAILRIEFRLAGQSS